MLTRGIIGGKRGRPRAFIIRDDGVFCEDVNIAASFLCFGEAEVKIIEDGKPVTIKKEYKPGTFFGTVIGKEKVEGQYTGRPVFMFHIKGDVGELCERKRLWFLGAHRMNPREHLLAKNHLLDALRGAMEDAKTGKRIIPMKETIFDAKIQGGKIIRSSGASAEEGRDGRTEPDSQPGTESTKTEVPGTDTSETEGSETEVAVGGDE